MNIKLTIFIIFSTFSTLLASDDLNRFPTDTRYYTIQIKSYPYQDHQQAQELYHSLKSRNYPVYHQTIKIKGEYYTRIRLGVFNNFEKAKWYANKLKAKEDYDYFIDFADIFSENFNDSCYVITTPQLVYFWDGKNTKVLFDKPITEEARLSPNRESVVLSHDQQIFKIFINTGENVLLKGKENSGDSLISPKATWSPDGKYIAYLIYNDWELKTELWIMNQDGKNDQCLIPFNGQNEYCVKNYIWHPIDNSIFYVFGYAFGTVSVGGDIYTTDLKGNYKPVVFADRDKREEIYRNFRIEGDTLYYKKVHFLDDQYMKREYKLYTHSLN